MSFDQLRNNILKLNTPKTSGQSAQTSFMQKRQNIIQASKPQNTKKTQPIVTKKQPTKSNVKDTLLKYGSGLVKSALTVNNPVGKVLLDNKKTIQRIAAEGGKILQKTPDTTVKIEPKKKTDKEWVGGRQKIGPVSVPVSKLGAKAIPFATGIVGESIKSYGKTLERLNTERGQKEIVGGAKDLVTKEIPNIARNPKKLENYLNVLKNPAVQTGLDVSDALPGIGVASISLKKLFKKGGKEVVESGIERKLANKVAINKAFEPGVKNVRGLLSSKEIGDISGFIDWARKTGAKKTKADPKDLEPIVLMTKAVWGNQAANTWTYKKMADAWEYTFKRLSEGKRVPIGLEMEDVSKNFVRKNDVAQAGGETLYHGGAKIDQVNLNKSNFDKTFYMSDSPDYAKSFGGSKSVVNEMKLDPKANLIDMRKPTGAQVSQISEAIDKEMAKPAKYGESFSFYPYTKAQVIEGIQAGKAHFAELPQVKKILRKLGYDGQITAEVPYAKNVGVWNKDIVKPHVAQPPVTGMLGKIKATLKDQRGFLKIGAEVEPPKLTNKSLSSNQKLTGISPEKPPMQGTQSMQENPLSPNANKVSLDELYQKTARETGDKPNVVKNVVNKISEAKTKVIEYVQNESERVRKLVNKKGVSVDDASDPYLKSTLYSGRMSEKISQGKEEAEKLIKEMKGVSKNFKTDLKGMRKEVNDYLYYRHAPERNAAIGEKAAGITTEEAQAGLKALEGTPQAGKVKEFADRISNLNSKTLDMLKDSGVITDDLYDTLRAKYKYHVPLNRIFDDTEDVGGALAAKGFSVKSTGIKSAKGSEREVDDILGNVISNYEQAVLRSEKNIVDQATLSFVRKNKDILGNLFEVTSPKAVGKTFDGKPILERTTDPTVLQMFEKGKRVWVKINDKNLATALQGIGREKLPTLLKAVGSVTRFYSGLATRFNPEFAFPNKMRDLQETAVYLASQKGMGFTGAAKTALRDSTQQNTKAIIDSLRGKNTEGARLYKELKELGGTTGGFGLSTRNQVEMNLKNIEKLANSKTKRVADNLVRYIDNWNTIFEDSTRLSVYRQGLKQGLSKERAAFLAKEASINFNRMGKGGPVINALWMFSNASIQGSTKMIRALKNPKVLGATVATVAGSVGAINEWNDKVDPNWRDKVSKWDRLNGLPVVLPNQDGQGVKYFTIPVSWGIKPIKVMTDYAYDAAAGESFDPKDMVGTMFSTMLEAYNPVGGTDWMSALAPSVLDIPIEIARNKSWSGSKIRPDYDPKQPEDLKYFPSLTETKTGQTAISISEMLQSKSGILVSPANMKYAFDQYIGGAGRFLSKTFNTIEGVSKGQPVKPSEYPILSRFYREKSADEVPLTARTQPEVQSVLDKQNRERVKIKAKINPIYRKVQELKNLGREAEAQRIVDSLSEKEYDIYKDIKTAEKSRKTKELKEAMQPVVLRVRKLKDQGKNEEAQALVDEMTDDQYDAYKSAKKQLGIE